MVRNYFRVIHSSVTIEKIIIGNTQPAHDVRGMSPEGPLKLLTSGTYRVLSGDSQGTNTKIYDFVKKLFFRSNRPCIIYLFLLFTRRTNIQKFQTGTSAKRLRDPVAGRPWDQMMGRSRDVRGTSVKHVLKRKHTIIETGNTHDEFREILLKFDLRICG